MTLDASFGQKFVNWVTRLREGQGARLAQREGELRALLEKNEAEIAAATRQDAGALRAEVVAVERENATLKAEITKLEQSVPISRQRWLECELERRGALLSQWRERDAAVGSEERLAELTEVERLLSGRPDSSNCWQEGGAKWQWDSLTGTEGLQIRDVVQNSSGIIYQVLAEMNSRVESARAELSAIPDLQAQLDASRQLAAALSQRLKRLEAALAEDKARSFDKEELRTYYLGGSGNSGLKPDEAWQLINDTLQPLCQDAILEFAVWRIHARGELRALAPTEGARTP
jgi:hypothetical protein